MTSNGRDDDAASRNSSKRKLRRENSLSAFFYMDSANLDFDDILPLLHEFGLYQKLLFLMMIPFLFFTVFVYFGQFFMTLMPEHRCKIDELMHLTKEKR